MADTPAFDLLLTGATVATVDAADTVIDDAAIGVAGGRIAWVGPASALPAGVRATRTVALPGRLVVPGLVNVHTHAILSMVRGA